MKIEDFEIVGAYGAEHLLVRYNGKIHIYQSVLCINPDNIILKKGVLENE
jgi:hypothetical protein